MTLHKMRMRSDHLLPAVLLGWVLMAGCMNMKHSAKEGLGSHGPGQVWMKKDGFSPSTLTIPLNTTVTWTNKDWWAHTVSSDAAIFESGKIHSGKTYTYQFKVAGTYSYHCTIHDNMVGKIIVQ